MFPAGVSFDTFATARVNVEQRNASDFGGGLGLNAFFTKHVGLGAEVLSTDPTHGNVVDEANLKAIVRIPIGIISPYGFGGAGRSFEDGKYTLFGGAGLELKVSKNASLFADGRYVREVEIKDNNHVLARAGLRFNF